MEIVSVERKTFEELLAGVNALADKIAALQRKTDGKRLSAWMTGEDVCAQLRISTRTLQTLRSKRLIGYTQVNRQFYYTQEDVKRLLPLAGTISPTRKRHNKGENLL
ncbi:MAG: helix-turn-helix domain-containing protein [Prevotella sp.]|nr:helix-turn-helix domain-containing protein [Prevotella sp.]